MTDLDLIVDRICEAAGADFAFVLTRRGRLVTQHAPQEMPESGRNEIVEAAERVLRGDALARGLIHLELPREKLVPYGGAAPVDVYVAAREEAVLCIVMATFSAQHNVGKAVAAGLVELDALLERESSRRARRRGHAPVPSSMLQAPAPKASSSKGRRGMPHHLNGNAHVDFDNGDFDDGPGSSLGERRATVPFMQPYSPQRKITPPPFPPEITVGEASVGRTTLAAIQLDAEGPDITYGEASLGRATIAEIELSMVPSGDPRSSMPEVRVSLASLPDSDLRGSDPLNRQTLPFVMSPVDLKRDFEARVAAQNDGKAPRGEPAPPHDEASKREAKTVPEMAVARASHVELRVDPPPSTEVTSSNPTTVPEKSGPRMKRSVALPRIGPLNQAPRDSGIELWHAALGAMSRSPESDATAPASAPPVTAPPEARRRAPKR